MKNIIIQMTLLLICSNAFAADTSLWSKYNSAGEAAYKRGDLAQASGLFRAALNEAQKPGEQSVHLAASLLRLAEVYKLQGRNSEAEPLMRSYSLLQQQMQKRTHHMPANHGESSPNVGSAKSSNPNSKSGANSNTQKMGGGWDLNDLRINRRFSY